MANIPVKPHPELIEVDFDRAVSELHKSVELKGADHVVSECVIYRAVLDGEEGIVDKTPVCIVGQVLYQIAPERFMDVGHGAVAQPASSVGISLSREAYKLLSDAQAIQDNQIPWGRTVKQALALSGVED